MFFVVEASGIEREQSFEDEESPTRRRANGTAGRPGKALSKSVIAGDTIGRRSARRALPEQQPRKASLDVEVTQ